MYMECDELQSQLKESLLHALFEHVCSLASKNQIIVIPALVHFTDDNGNKLPEVIIVRRMYTEYKIYTDFPIKLLNLTPYKSIPTTKGSSLTFKYDCEKYFDSPSSGFIQFWLFKKPKESKK